ncbi:glycoprotein [Lyssavirus aravan]|uniref:Glycoprotein n=1 Tax=Aravan virus TaxID=211977 RepID=GLYCO_ARAV|nr:glycoprotein [Lyssavirus aravan]Q6X1D5.1 RecName: Full=Glycoprotein; Flags: Precursor [Lyssavirus aravan]AAP86775.1 glycoprotein [Lyssavirus aravan]
MPLQAIPLFSLILPVLVAGKFPIYTIPDKIGPWSPIDINHLSCPNNLVVEDEGCTTLTAFSYMELKVGYITTIKVSGFTCTGVVTEAETYTNFVGYVTTTFRRKHFRPTASACREAYNWKATGDPRYEESLHNPYPDSHWLRTVKTTKESLLIISPSVADMDAYDKALYSKIFPNGKCLGVSLSSPFCSTNHDYTLWMPENPKPGVSCDIFTTSKGKKATKDGKLCGFVDERGLYKSLKGACKLKLCGVMGLRLMDGSWVSLQKTEESEWCSPNQLINIHDFHSDEIEHMVVEELVKKREECLDALESIMTTKSISFRRLSHLRKLVPGFGKAYTLINKTLMEADAHYKSVREWTEVIPSKGCLKAGGGCYPHYNRVFFNGIILSPDGHVLIPEMQSALLQQHIELLESSVIPLRHPLADPSTVFKGDDEAEEFVEVHLPDTQKQISGIDLGLPEWKRYFLMGMSAIGFLALTIILAVCCRRIKRRKQSKPNPVELIRKVSVTSQSGRAIPSWESYKVKTGDQPQV